MKKFFQFPILIFRLFMILSGAAVLFSCNNFLDGGDFKEQLDKDIARAKETPFTVNIILANPIHGQLNTTTQKLKKGDSFELSFIVANGFIFEEWTCTDNTAIKFEDPKKPNTKVTALKSSSELSGSVIITPICSERFVVKSVSPENKQSGVERDSPIVITFNNPADSSTFEENFSITSENGASLRDYYGEPIWFSDNTVVKLSAIRDNPIITDGFIDVTIKLGSNITSSGSSKKSLGEDSVYTYRLNSNYDNVQPTFVDFRLAKTEEKLGIADSSKRDLIPLTSFEESEVFHVGKKVYIYCKGYDDGSGVYYLMLNGSQILARGSFELTDKENSYYEAAPLEIDISTFADGEIELKFALYDYSDNKAATVLEYKVFKDSVVSEQDTIKVYNKLPEYRLFPREIKDPHAQTYELPFYDYNSFLNGYKTFYLTGLKNDYWGSSNETILGKDNIKLRCGSAYAKFINYSKDEDLYTFTFDNLDTTSKEDLPLEVIISDAVNNEYVVRRDIPNGTNADNFVVESTWSTDTLNFSPQKTGSESELATSFEYRIFYESEFNDTTIARYDAENIHNKDIGRQCLYEYDSRWYSNPDDYTLLSFDYYFNQINDYWATYSSTKNYIEKNKKYIFDTYYSSQYYTYAYYPEAYTTQPVFSQITDIDAQKYPVSYTYSHINMTASYLQLNDSSTQGERLYSVDCYIVPIYSYSDKIIYGKPVKKHVDYGSPVSSTNYTLSYTKATAYPVSCGANTGKCKLELNNVKIVDSTGKDVTSDFNMNYYTEQEGAYQTNSTCSLEPVLYFSSVLEDGTFNIVINAVKKDDKSIVVSKREDGCEIKAIDNYAPTISDMSYDAEYSLWDDGSYYTMRIPLIYDCLRSSKTSYDSYIMDECLNSKGMFNVATTDYTESVNHKINYEYYWLPYESEWGNKKPVLSEDAILSRTAKKGTSYFTWSSPDNGSHYTQAAFEAAESEGSKTNSMYVPIDELSDGKYLLCIKIFDQVGNYTIKPFLYHTVATYNAKPKITVNTSSPYTFNVSFDITDSSRNVKKAVIERFVINSNGWQKVDEINLSSDFTGSSTYALLGSNYYRIWIVSRKDTEDYRSAYSYPNHYYAYQKKKENYCYSKPFYFGFYTGSYTMKANLMEGIAGYTIIGNSVFAQTYYSYGEGYGDDLSKWERYGIPYNGKFFSGSEMWTYTGQKDVPAGCSYVVAVYWPECNNKQPTGYSLMSSVHKK